MPIVDVYGDEPIDPRDDALEKLHANLDAQTNVITALVRRNGGQVIVKMSELGADEIGGCVLSMEAKDDYVILTVRRELDAPERNGTEPNLSNLILPPMAAKRIV